jgi:hypothetical protein
MQSPAAGPWMAAAFAVELAVACFTLAVLGTNEHALFIALRATARWSFLVFWLAYTGGALATLCGPRFAPLARRGRALGLAFAAAHLVHAGLVLWLYRVATHPPVPRSSLTFFAIALFFTYLLALGSIRNHSRRIVPGSWPKLWPAVRTIGVHYIALAFLVDFARNPFRGSPMNLVLYLPFLILAATTPFLRLAAYLHRLGRARGTRHFSGNLVPPPCRPPPVANLPPAPVTPPVT